mgnify:CR=1 FL=1
MASETRRKIERALQELPELALCAHPAVTRSRLQPGEALLR